MFIVKHSDIPSNTLARLHIHFFSPAPFAGRVAGTLASARPAPEVRTGGHEGKSSPVAPRGCCTLEPTDPCTGLPDCAGGPPTGAPGPCSAPSACHELIIPSISLRAMNRVDV